MLGLKAFLFLGRDFFGRLENILHERAKLLALPGAAIFQLVPCPRQQILIPYIGFGVKEPAEDFVFLVAVGVEKLPELPLGQHDDFAKLLGIEAQQGFNARADSVCPFGGGAVRLI